MKELNKNIYKKFDAAYTEDKTNRVIEGAISNLGLKEASKNQRVINQHKFIFNEEVDHKNITDQKKTGRCWMFAALNMARPKIMADLNLEEFEFSQSYLYFYDNMEKSNVFLEKIIASKDLDINSREVVRALSFGTDDGGYFEHFKGLIEKYGIVPKNVMGESFHTEDSGEMFSQIQEILKKYAMDIRRAKGAKEIQNLKEACLAKVYTILVKCIGKPVDFFDFEYVDKDKVYHIDKGLTPKTFYEKYLGDFYDPMIRLVNDPRSRHPYGRVYTSPDIKNMEEGEGLKGLNVPMKVMKEALIKSLKDKKTAWFACDVGKMSDRKAGILDEALYNYEDTLVSLGDYSKADRIDSRQSAATHAMNITGVHLKDGKPDFWKVENSWGNKNGKKGIFSMADTWFEDYTYELIVDKKYVDPSYLKGLDLEPIAYDPYDAFSSIFSREK